jgi:hypothetical protein
MLLIYNNPDALAALSEDDRTALFGEVDTIMEELTKSGELVPSIVLPPPLQAKTVRVHEGVPVATDGPYLEAKELLAGYLTVEVDSVDRAVEIAARWPAARAGAMEVRAVMHTAGLEM